MIPIVAAMLGGAVVLASSYGYRKLKSLKKSYDGLFQINDIEPSPILDELKGFMVELRGVAAIVVTQSATTAGQQLRVVKNEVRIVAGIVYDEAQTAYADFAEKELKPLQQVAGEEWHALKEAITDDEGLLADGAVAAREFIGRAAHGAAELKDKAFASSALNGLNGMAEKRQFRSFTPKAVWRSLKQAKGLVFSDDVRDRQFDEMGGPAESTARTQIQLAEDQVNRYLKVAASSLVASTVGVALLPPVKLVAGAMILYAALPVFKGAYVDIVENRKITIKLLDSISFIGLLAGGYFLICSITSTIFHASTKMMLKTEDRSRQMLANLFGEQPRTVWVIVDGTEVEIPFEQLKTGDRLIVHAGQMIPIDGIVRAGTAAVDQHVLTGESQPAEKGPGERVFAATVLLAGRVEVQVEKTGAETAAAQIRDVLANTTDFRSAIQARWRGVADHTVLPTLGLSGVALAFLGPASALAVVNSNYVAVMKVASPLGMLNFLQRASQAGILIKDGRALEAASRVDTVVFDKTGTLTENEPHVGQIIPAPGVDADDLLRCAAAVEAKQNHPIAQAIVKAARARDLELPGLEEERYEIGFGIEARVGERLVRVGSARFMVMKAIDLPAGFRARQEAMQENGSSVVFVAFEDKLAGAIELRPTLRPEAREVVRQLKDRGLTLFIISGDHAAPTEALATELGIDHYFAEVLPQDKSAMVERLQKEGRNICFIGDGINDAIALKKANVSVSLRGASSLATNTAQIILMDESLRQLGQLFEVAHDYNANLKTLMTTTFVPGVASLLGVFLLGTANATALMLFNLSMLAGLANAIFPALQNMEEVAEDVRPGGTAGEESPAPPATA